MKEALAFLKGSRYNVDYPERFAAGTEPEKPDYKVVCAAQLDRASAS